MKGSKRVGIVGLLQESNTFIAERTTYLHFETGSVLRGELVREFMGDAPHEVGGFFSGLGEAGVEAVPIYFARALPFGIIERSAFERLVEEMLEEVRKAGALDGMLAASHGATVAEGYPDADGYWLSKLREAVGSDIPLIATLDPHANLTCQIVASTDALVAYSTNPHLDQRETGVKSARIMSLVLDGECRPSQAAVFPPMAINIQSQNTSARPLAELCQLAAGIADFPGILSWSLILGFPYADVEEMGSSVVVVSDDDPELANETAAAIAKTMWEMREAFEPNFLSVERAVSLALQSAEQPVVMLDMGDNTGGGSPANSTVIVHEWLRRDRPDCSAFVCLHDPIAVEMAFGIGAGSVCEGNVGDPADPLRGRFLVRSLHDGLFRETAARHGGFSEFNQGPTALLELEETGLFVMATHFRMAPFSLAQLTSFGIDPRSFHAIVAKGVIAPMAAYEEVASGGFLHVDSPGVTRADMTKLSYHHRRAELFPFERSTRYPG